MGFDQAQQLSEYFQFSSQIHQESDVLRDSYEYFPPFRVGYSHGHLNWSFHFKPINKHTYNILANKFKGQLVA